MKTRRAQLKDDGNSNKRQRFDDGAAAAVPSIGFVALNDDCLLHILSNLRYGDLNNVALVNRRLSVIRNHESLDQTREAIILCSRSRRPSLRELRSALRAASVELTENYTRMKVLGIESVTNESNYVPPSIEPVPSISTLELGTHPDDGGNGTGIPHIVYFCHLMDHLPNAKEVLLSEAKYGHMFNDHVRFIGEFIGNCPIERLTIQTASRSFVDLARARERPVPQQTLMAIVRYLPSLRWFKSELTEDNVAILQRERPEITFVWAGAYVVIDVVG